MKFKEFIALFIIFALLLSCASMPDKKINSKKYSSKENKLDNGKYRSSKSFFSGNPKFNKSMQKFGKGVGNFFYSSWKVVAKFFNDCYSFIAKQLDNLSKTKFIREITKVED